MLVGYSTAQVSVVHHEAVQLDPHKYNQYPCPAKQRGQFEVILKNTITETEVLIKWII